MKQSLLQIIIGATTFYIFLNALHLPLHFNRSFFKYILSRVSVVTGFFSFWALRKCCWNNGGKEEAQLRDEEPNHGAFGGFLYQTLTIRRLERIVSELNKRVEVHCFIQLCCNVRSHGHCLLSRSPWSSFYVRKPIFV